MLMTHMLQLFWDCGAFFFTLMVIIPVLLVTTIFVTQMYTAMLQRTSGFIFHVNRYSCIACGAWMTLITLFLITWEIIPLSYKGEWIGAVDKVATLSFTAGCLPMILLGCVSLELIGKKWEMPTRIKVKTALFAVFAVIMAFALIMTLSTPVPPQAAPEAPQVTAPAYEPERPSADKSGAEPAASPAPAAPLPQLGGQETAAAPAAEPAATEPAPQPVANEKPAAAEAPAASEPSEEKAAPDKSEPPETAGEAAQAGADNAGAAQESATPAAEPAKPEAGAEGGSTPDAPSPAPAPAPAPAAAAADGQTKI